MPHDNSASYKNEDLPLLFSKEADVPGSPRLCNEGDECDNSFRLFDKLR